MAVAPAAGVEDGSQSVAPDGCLVTSWGFISVVIARSEAEEEESLEAESPAVGEGVEGGLCERSPGAEARARMEDGDWEAAAGFSCSRS